MLSASPALPQRQRDVLGGIIGLLLLVGIFGVVMHGMPDTKIAHAQPVIDLGVATTVPARVPPTTSVPVTTPRGYTARDIGVRADWGTTPERITNTTQAGGHTVEAIMYGVVRGDMLVMVGSSTVPDEVGSNMNEFVDGFALGFQSKVESSSALKFQGHDARDVKLRMNDGRVARALLIRMNGRVVEVVVGAKTDPEAEYRAFVKSVELL